ncbi:molybdopterin-guanine dinucleotide biosynthesis protein B [Methylacidiphilum caldifontis]|uniref:molybdopterin-guanine dinucleotide biosynthesis protein B n=1 Tax=Methylacidiphilum caldifontis TaxID=2795386 RepID=UPI00106B43BC|nr:molybdopterin-guanine dinucleotide biosynthesis protein B [Methylacidiphilum caldifontis]
MTVFGFVGRSGCGKTTLICKLIRYFSSNGLRVGAFKHAHKGFQLDYPGKDSYSLKEAGASAVCLLSGNQSAMIFDYGCPQEMIFQQLVKFLNTLGCDILFIEGLKKESHFPKLCFVERVEESELSLKEVVSCVGLITQTKESKDFWENKPVFFRDDVSAISSFILHWINPSL